jgi:biotin transport system substrate-specific component
MSVVALRSRTYSAVDRLRPHAGADAFTQAVGVLAFAGLAALGAQVEIRLPLWEVPVTLQTVGVYGAGLFLGARNGLLSMLLYVAAGLLLPVYAGGAAGVAHIAGATGGYLLAMPLAALTAGAVSRRWNAPAGALVATLAASAVLFSIGVTWLHFAAGHDTWWQSIDRGWLRFVAWDLTKVALVATMYSGARRLGA